MFNTLKLGYVVTSANVIPNFDNSYLLVFELSNFVEILLFRANCSYIDLTINDLQNYVDRIVTGILYDELNNELEIFFDNCFSLNLRDLNIDSLLELNNK